MWKKTWIFLIMYFARINCANCTCPGTLEQKIKQTEVNSTFVKGGFSYQTKYQTTVLPFALEHSQPMLMPMDRSCRNIHGVTGRQLYLTERYNESDLLENIAKFNYLGAARVRLALFVSKVKGTTFIFHPNNETLNLNCNLVTSTNCSPSAVNAKQCGAMGCCFDPKSGSCSYPAKQEVVRFKPTKQVDINIVNGDNMRYCAELVKTTTSPVSSKWIWKSYECFRNESHKVTTLNACEFQCNGSWIKENWDTVEFGDVFSTTTKPTISPPSPATTTITTSLSITTTAPKTAGPGLTPPTAPSPAANCSSCVKTVGCVCPTPVAISAQAQESQSSEKSQKKDVTAPAAIGAVVGAAVVLGAAFGMWKYFHRHSSVATDSTPKKTSFDKKKIPKQDPVEKIEQGECDSV